MEAGLDKYGMSNRLSNIKLEPKQAYDVVLRNDKTMSINIITKPEGAIASLETGQKKILRLPLLAFRLESILLQSVIMGKH